MLIIDAHEDIAWNMLTFGRDYTRSAAETRRLEVGTLIPRSKEDATLGWPDYQRGRVAVVFATLFGIPSRLRAGEWDTQAYADVQQAHSVYNKQLDLYHRLTDEHPDMFTLIQTRGDLELALSRWQTETQDEPAGGSSPDPKQQVERRTPQQAERLAGGNPVGLVILMEGAEGVRDPAELEEWWGRGLRIIGPAWAGTRFCGGTREPGKLTPEGYALLEGMAGFPYILDLTHMDEAAAVQALDVYPGPIVATHSNALALLKGSDSNRHLPDNVIRGILERDGVIGVVPFNVFLRAGWRQGDRRDGVTIQHVVEHIDYICQMAGDALHVGFGSDFDGGFGLQSIPEDMDTVADLARLAPLLSERGYCQTNIEAILGGNWLRPLRRVLS